MWTNKKTSIGVDALKLTASKIITLAIVMITAMLLSRFLTLEEYGTYSQILLAINLITSLLMLGLPNSINYFLARAESKEEMQKFLSVYYTLSTLLSIAVGLALVCVAPLIIKYFNNELIKTFVYFFTVYPWTKIISSGIDNILIVYKKTSMLLIYRVSNSIALLLIILIVQTLKLNFDTYMILFLAVEVVFAASVFIIVKGLSKKLYISLDTDLIKKILTFSIPIGLASAVGTLNIEIDKLMIGNFFDVEHLAIYTNASKEMPVTIIAMSLTAVLMPQLVRLLKKNKNNEAIELWSSATLLAYTFICVLATVFFVFAPDVMTLFYSEKYLPGVSVFRVFNIVLLLRCTYFGMILNSKGKTRFIFYSSIASLVLNVILNYVLYYKLGFIGPAIATLLSQATINILQLVYSCRITNIKFKKIMPWNKMTIITVMNLLLGVILYFIKDYILLEKIVGSIIESIILGCIGGLLYLVICFVPIKMLWKSLNKGD